MTCCCSINMKLSESQKQNVHLLLSYLSDRDMLSLANTVTNNLTSFASVKDAREAVILHEIDLPSLLSRRKITREILFKYLHHNKINTEGNTEKACLIIKFLEVLRYHSKEVSQIEVKAADVNTLAHHFASWFYNILNDCITSQKSNMLCVEHFWNDCNLHLVMEFPMEKVVGDVNRSSEEVVQILKNIQLEHKLYFNPNISSSGTRGKVNMHGLVMVMVCGTLHQADSCVGVFQQVFGLVRDPFMQNNWRIKSTNLLLKSQVTSPPMLKDECFDSFPLPQ